MTWQLVAMTVVVGAVLVGAVRLAVAILRWYRKNRGAAAEFAFGALLQDALGDWVDSVSASSWTPFGSDHQPDHHSYDSASTAHHHGNDNSIGSDHS